MPKAKQRFTLAVTFRSQVSLPEIFIIYFKNLASV